MASTYICGPATEVWVVVLWMEWECVCETECLALFRRAKQRSDSQEAVLKVRLSNDEVKDERTTFVYRGVWYNDHKYT